MKSIVIVLGNQLFSPALLKARLGIDWRDSSIFMREDRGLCTFTRHHKQKILFFLASMRSYAHELREAGFSVHYEFFGQDQLTYVQSLTQFISENKIELITHFEVEDHFFEDQLDQALKSLPVSRRILNSPMFLTQRETFREYLRKHPTPRMKTFYPYQRIRLGILVDDRGLPTGGKWSFDTENRKPLPVRERPPRPSTGIIAPDPALIELINREFQSHPGSLENYWLPTDRKGAKGWLTEFLRFRFSKFGDYEDALAPDSDFVFHSALTPFLNVGWLLPDQVIRAACLYAEKMNVPINSLEGFIRQILGWREFVRGIYHNFDAEQSQGNFFNATRHLSPHWYRGESGSEPLDQVIHKVLRLGYAHHIERLMVVGSLMLLLEIHPGEAHRWFMEMFIDSSDWVMGPNVYGMALFSDGGIFATKPYFCGANYYRKMGRYSSGDWEDGVNGLYWSFIGRHRAFLVTNPRLSATVKAFDQMDEGKKLKIFNEAEKLRHRLTR
jgi:deoxyribodipyrimidine photolyase-related protein